MTAPDENAPAAKAQAILDRVARESAGPLDSAMRRAADHFSGKDAAREGLNRDWAEIWGRRVGRALGALFLVVLVVNLFTRWFF